MEERTHTLVGEANLTPLADNLGILFRLLYGGRDQVLELQRCGIRERRDDACKAGEEKSLTREIFTDCERACDNDSFVLRGVKLECSLTRRRRAKFLTCSLNPCAT